MKSKKIIIAALSLGLIFAPTKPLVFAADAELAEVDFDSKRLNLIHKQEIVTGKTENEYKKIKAISDEALKILNSEKNKETELERNIQNLKTELEANPSNDRKIEIMTEINDLENQLDQQNQKIDELDQDYKEKKEKRAHYEYIASVERYLLSDYRSAKRDIDLEIADAKYQIRVFRNQGLLDDEERNSFISEINTVSKTENPEDYIKIYESARAKAEQKKSGKLTENTETETDNQTPDQNETTAPNKEELKAAKESAIENLKSKTNLTETQEKSFREEISNAENLEELAEINKKVNEADEEAAKAKEVSEAKDKAKQSLENAENIDSEQKASFEKKIEDAETIDQLLEIESNIKLSDDKAQQEKIAQELAAAKESAIENLKSKSNLTEDQEKSFQEAIRNAENLEELAEINKKVDEAEEEASKEKEVSEAKDKAKQSLESSEHINSEQKVIFENQIEEADTIDKILEIENNIKLADEKAKKEKIAQELANSKQILEEKLENTNLSTEQKDAFKDRILNAKNQAELEAIQIDIDQADEKVKKEKELEENKKILRENLNSKENLRPDQKEEFEKQIAEATEKEMLAKIEEEINQADENAKKEKASQELENAKTDLAEKLNSKENLRPDQKDEFEKQISEANDKETLANIEEEITLAVEVAKKEKIAQELAAAKESAIENLKAKINLTEAQVKLFEEEINNAENLEELAEINKKVDEAEQKAIEAKELSGAKNKVKLSLENVKNINIEQKAYFEKQIEDAETVEQLLEIENNIKLADENAKKEKIAQELANSKQILEEKLENTILTQDQKDEFEKQISEANDKEALAKIEEKINVAIEVANKEKTAEELKAAKESSIENLKSKTNLTEAQVKLFEEEINNVENLEELAEINKKVNEADEKAAKAKEVSEAKDNAKQSLESSEHIDSEQKVIFENQIEEVDTIDKILEIENNIKLADEKAKKEKIAQELANSKQILEEKLENTNLSPEQKDAFKGRILNSENQAELEAIQVEIDQTDEIAKKEKANQELEANKKSLIENLNSKENLRPDQKAEFEKQIAEANDKEALAKIEEKINVAVEVANKEKTIEELKAAKESSIENLKTKDNLTDVQEKSFREEISNAENLEELAEINKKVNEADEKAKQEKVSQELENAKQLLEEKLENTGLSPEQKDTFKNRILKAESQAELETIESDINQADENAKKEKASQELENAKTALAEKLFATSLNQDQKDSFLEKIHNVTDLEVLEAIDKEIEIASNQVDENIENETEKDPSNEENPSTPDPEEEKPKDEEKDPSEEKPNEEEAGSLPENQDDNTTEKPDPSNEDSVDDDNELENNPQNPDPDNGNTDSSDTSENVENTPTDDNSANGRENNTADGENPEKTSPEGQRPRNTKITRPISDDINPVSRPLENPSYLPSTITINETSTAKKDTIELKDDLKYLKKGTYKISDLEAKRDKIEEAIKKNKATVRAIGILEDLAPKTLAKNRAKINALLKQSQRLLAQANYALAEYNYLLSK